MTDRGRADPVSVEGEVERDAVEYLPENDAVRYVSAWVHSDHEAFVAGENTEREPRYATTPFDEWAPTECAHVGARHVLEVVRTRLERGSDDVSYTVGTENGSKVIYMTYSTTYGRNGSVFSEPSVDHDGLVEATPQSVTATISIDGRNHTETVPVIVKHSVERLE
ncbi:hypothetical protein [Halorussus aquaticus]|uniref:Uncharacterized protein n=1 Tax=Halorussus aquaticus TaxID=2953748 RepID=A0ABD5PXW4_9EURY|nr:hypothetical protein [Halorussus aquaticus]